MVSFKIPYFQKSFACIGCFGLFSGMGLAYTADFHHTFPIKNFPYYIPYQMSKPSFIIWGEWRNGLRLYNQDRKAPSSNPTWHSARLFITVIWLSHSQLWAIPKEVASLTQCLSRFFLQFRLEAHRSFVTTKPSYKTPGDLRVKTATVQ